MTFPFRNAVALISAMLAILLSFMPVFTGERDIAIKAHHLDHAVLMFFGAIAGLSVWRPRSDLESPHWIWPAVLGPLVAMALMAPTYYTIVDRQPFLHSFNHLLFALIAGFCAYAGQRYVRGVGWASALLLELMAVAAAFGYGVAPTVASFAAPAASSTAAATADVTRGKQVFAQNCASCHGLGGAGSSLAPSLKNEHVRKNEIATVAWIKHPAPPMPALYPSILNDRDVRDVAAYVESLK